MWKQNKTGKKSNVIAIFHAIRVFAAELCSTLPGNSLEEPLGELPDPLFSKRKHTKVSASAEKHTARTNTHTHTHWGMQGEWKKQKKGNKGGKQMWCYVPQQGGTLLSNQTCNPLYCFSPEPFHHSAIAAHFWLLTPPCDTMKRAVVQPSHSRNTGMGIPCAPEVQNTPPLCITHLRYLSSL